MALTVFHTVRTRSIRVRWLLEEMGLPYELERMDYAFGAIGGDDYKAVHPLQKVPALRDGDVEMVESIAILEYVLAKYGPSPLAVSAQETEFAAYLQWLHYGEAGMGMAFNLFLGHTSLLPEKHRNKDLAAWAARELSKQLGFVGQGLGDKDCMLARGFTAADISIGYVLFVLKLMRRSDLMPETVQAYAARLFKRPAWKAASAD